MRTIFKSLNCKSDGAPTASSATTSYVFIIMDNKLKENNTKWTFSFTKSISPSAWWGSCPYFGNSFGFSSAENFLWTIYYA